jgi:hypothetical protein
MHKQKNPGLQFQNQIFPAALDFADSPPLEFCPEIFLNRLAQGHSGKRNLFHAFPYDGFPEFARKRFNFGQFRHFVSSTRIRRSVQYRQQLVMKVQ